MRDLRLSFWAAIYGAIGMLVLIVLRAFTYKQNDTYNWYAVINYLLTFAMLLIFMRAIRCALKAVETLRRRRGYLLVIFAGLLFLLINQLVLQTLNYVAHIQLMDNYLFLTMITIVSIPSMVGLMGFYIFRQMRGRLKVIPAVFTVLCGLWVFLRMLDQVFLPLLWKTEAIGDSYAVLRSIAALNRPLSMFIFIASFVSLVTYAIPCGITVRKMPETQS